MTEYSLDLNRKYSGVKAIKERVKLRLLPRAGNIPYFHGGLPHMEFTLNPNLSGALNRLLADMSPEVTVTQEGTVITGDVVITVGDLLDGNVH